MENDNNEPRSNKSSSGDDDTERPPALSFTPVPVRYRHDGWTPERQIAFVEALAECACVDEAARRVGMNPKSAYDLRKRPSAMHFRDAWDAALDMTMLQVEQGAVKRSVHGVPRPIFYKGEQVGEWRHHDERMTMFLLRYRRRARFGAWYDHLPPSPPPLMPGDQRDDSRDDCAERLDWHCEEIEEEAWREGEAEGEVEDAPNDEPDPGE